MDYPFGRSGVGDPVFMTVFGATLGIGTHFSAKGGCKAGMLDLLVGAAALAADYNGLENTPNAIEKLSILISWAEEAYSAAIGAEVEGGKQPSGVWLPDIVKSRANK